MRKLIDYEGEGGKWLTNGWHTVTIKDARLFQYNSGSDGVEFELAASGAKQKIAFCLVDTILWRLADFCKACGLTKAELNGYDVDNMSSQRAMIGRKVSVVVIPDPRDSKYGIVDDWQPADEKHPPPRRTPEPPSRFVEPIDEKDGIPF